ncbi:MOSC N-terminal beta barrel domain-containing protein [Primorskyibacter aestuariivivens]|uniref:MOSC domain-containing protein n=1 Tax=Primorskyibacter aestuariivivens TaxID=1888912 RepID=UPI002301C377|nr:MOSC N-terminal beta barrel domain-containing protein [Primorskyibacter aestuariivivens]MDA7430418.1 MOSC N-terminal beta barrel domain-containing protein [Primorskyibacter aestuariivivens]
MTGRITQIFRHPIKSHGLQTVARVSLEEGHMMPWDRVWGVAHEASEADGSKWVSCANFSRVSKAPGLSAITADLDEATETVTLTHPELGSLTFQPDHEGDKLIAWAGGLIPENRAASARVIRGTGQGFSDSDFPSVTLCNMSSHRAVEQRVGQELSIKRWRGNFWFDGLAPWEEFDWIDREVRIGTAIVIPRERTDRCLATHNNPDTGTRDANVLGALDSWGHRDFSVRAEVVQAGDVAVGDTIGRA